ncbi:hypothetical protein EHE19_000840 [Ruminiclostridium herbifermentans]|uniref:Uncharacterized protein n=1 Tax=Ruminiclostridium herbifermentans TaxID=2488810 RepID=A0A4U7JGM5_9FIRM|nr:hypothetical protein [Ruminiclostridium herbifermentans]QNU67133.1 hypothetical protein EHE19_000840 [Ruminiclostridium herbifermentans]
MIEIITVILIAIGLTMIVSGVVIKNFKPSKSLKDSKTKKYHEALNLVERITQKGLIGKLLTYLTRNKEFFLNKFILKIIELSESGISLQQFYFLKIGCLFLCTLLVIVMGYTNKINQIKLLTAFSGTEKSAIFQDNSYDPEKYQLYKRILDSVGEEKLTKATSAEKYNLVADKMSEYLNTEDVQILQETTDWFLKSWSEIDKISAFKEYYIMLIIASTFLPELFLIIKWLIRGCIYKKEIIKLEYIFELLARVDGIKTIDIINELAKSSKIFSKYMNEFAVMFQFDKRSAFDYLKSRNIKGLSKMANILEIYSMSDKELAIQILDRETMERDEQMIITAEESIDFIDLVAFLSIVPIVYELARLMLDPMLNIVYKAFEFI